MSITEDTGARTPHPDGPALLVPQHARARASMSTAEEILGGLARRPAPRGVTIGEAPAADATHPDVVAHRALRRAVFVDEQGLFGGRGDDRDDTDADPRAIVLLARDASGTRLGGVRLGPARPGDTDLGWWTGSRLAVKIVDPGGEVLATTGTEAGLAVASIEVDDAVDSARRFMGHLRDMRRGSYGAGATGQAGAPVPASA